MNKSVEKCVRNLRFGEVQIYRDLAIFPVLGGDDDGPDYLTLEEALGQGLLTVKEVSEGGSVPELAVENRAGEAVLLLDGEELRGAKQNRVLNSTVLLAPESTTVIPVSCTEQGRWSYDSPVFDNSGVVMDHKIRHSKMASVSFSLRSEGSHRSDQGQVWEGIDKFHRDAGVRSRTSAMRDVYEARRKDFDECVRAFRPIEGQTGLLTFIGKRPAGLDVVSRPEAFAKLHGKLVRSYASDAVFGRRRRREAPAEGDCRAFAEQICGSTETTHRSVGLGEDCRYSSPLVCGSALVYRHSCIHGAFFAADERQNEQSGRMSSYRRRRGYRNHGEN